MALDILESRVFIIEYRYVYFDRKRRSVIARKMPIAKRGDRRYYPLNACVDMLAKRIMISPLARDKPLCLFHECLEILFSDWKANYFKVKKWHIPRGRDTDPIRYLEAGTWSKLSNSQKQEIGKYLPKGP